MLRINKTTLYIIFFIYFYSFLFSQESTKSNELILKELTLIALESFFKDIKLKSNDTISIKYIYDNEKQFLYDFIIHYLKDEKKHNLKFTEHLDDIHFEYIVNKLEISYTKPYRRKFLGEKIIIRNVSIEYFFKFINQNNIISYKPINVSYNDTINYNAIPNIENKMLTFTMAKIPEDSFIDKYTIPIITISTLSIIVYLFFTIRK